MTPHPVAASTPAADALAAAFIPTLSSTTVTAWAAGVRTFLAVMDGEGILDRRDAEPGRRSVPASRSPSQRRDDSVAVHAASSQADTPHIYVAPPTPVPAPARPAGPASPTSPASPGTMDAHARACAAYDCDSEGEGEEEDEPIGASASNVDDGARRSPLSVHSGIDAPAHPPLLHEEDAGRPRASPPPTAPSPAHTEIAGMHMPTGARATALVTTRGVRAARWAAWAAREAKARRVIAATVSPADAVAVAPLWCAFDQFVYLLDKYQSQCGSGAGG